MPQLSSNGRKVIAEIAKRHGFSEEAAESMLHSVVAGNGSMAQFDHAEFAGAGQWMRGGMTMVSDMFNHSLKSRVDALCAELSHLVLSEPSLLRAGSFQSQSSGAVASSPGWGDSDPVTVPAPLFAEPEPGAPGAWWPSDLGTPASAGSQNDSAYAYFPEVRRLAVKADGRITVYDTLGHRISGFSQQQPHRGTAGFSSESGPIDVANLPVVSGDSRTPGASPVPSPDTAAEEARPTSLSVHETLAAIEKLAELHRKGVLSDAEFVAKKAELLRRI